MNRILSLVMSIIIIFSSITVNAINIGTEKTALSNGIGIDINNREIFNRSNKRYIKNGRVMVGIRDVVQLLGGSIDWEESTKTIIIEEGTTHIRMPLGKNYVYLNGEKKELDQSVEVVNGRTYVPIRFISENLKHKVYWSKNTRTVKIDGVYPLDYEELTKDENELASLINQYRREKGLKELKVSKSLTKVARLHSYDQQHNYRERTDDRGKKGNMHSWSDKGKWSPMIYTDDHKYCESMWNKLRELTEYKGNGYEISYWNSDKAKPKEALKGWKGSPGHNIMIIGGEDWDDLSVMGVSIYRNYANVWFGEEEDPKGYHNIK